MSIGCRGGASVVYFARFVFYLLLNLKICLVDVAPSFFMRHTSPLVPFVVLII
jgi:hypothetical protein